MARENKTPEGRQKDPSRKYFGSNRVLVTVAGVFTVFLLVYLIYHTFFNGAGDYRTQTTQMYTYNQEVDTHGLVARVEQPVDQSISGYVSYPYQDGAWVNQDAVVALTYSSAEQAATLSQLRVLDDRIAKLQELQGVTTSQSTNLEALNQQINDSIGNIVGVGITGNAEDLADNQSQLLVQLTTRQLATGTAVDLSASLAQLQSQRDSISQNATPISSAAAPVAGYFSSKVDGLEGSITPDFLLTLNLEQLQSYEGQVQEPQTNTAGKIITDKTWSLAAIIPYDMVDDLRVGSQVELDFQIHGVESIPATVVQITQENNLSDAVVVFSTSYVLEELTNLRYTAVTVKFGTTTGLRVDESALQVVDGQKGVYVEMGYTVQFKPVEVLYEGNGFVLCDPNSDLDNALTIYDEVIIEGKDLYDGKIIK